LLLALFLIALGLVGVVVAVVVVGGRSDDRLEAALAESELARPIAGETGICHECFEPVVWLPLHGTWTWCDEPVREGADFLLHPHNCCGGKEPYESVSSHDLLEAMHIRRNGS